VGHDRSKKENRYSVVIPTEALSMTTIGKSITEADIELFARATGDFNPVHLEAAYAEKTM
jgi:acyl dehydratase